VKLARLPGAGARNTGGRREIERGIWSRAVAARTGGAGFPRAPDTA